MSVLSKLFAGIIISICANSDVPAQMDKFHDGSVIPAFGQIATVLGMQPISPDATFKVSFDVNKVAQPAELNRSLLSGARFINMHAEAGVKPENIKLAFVIHGQAVNDVTLDRHYSAVHNQKNANAALIAELLDKQVEIYVCGQSAAYYGVTAKDLLPGVTMSLSAMTAHALLQTDGYTLNPF